MSHTPGPWFADGPPDNIHILQEACGHIRICFLTSDGPTEANAALIAAAPEMYLALLDLKVIAEQHIEDLCADAQEGAPIARMELARWQRVLNAIAKAETPK